MLHAYKSRVGIFILSSMARSYRMLLRNWLVKEGKEDEEINKLIRTLNFDDYGERCKEFVSDLLSAYSRVLGKDLNGVSYPDFYYFIKEKLKSREGIAKNPFNSVKIDDDLLILGDKDSVSHFLIKLLIVDGVYEEYSDEVVAFIDKQNQIIKDARYNVFQLREEGYFGDLLVPLSDLPDSAQLVVKNLDKRYRDEIYFESDNTVSVKMFLKHTRRLSNFLPKFFGVTHYDKAGALSYYFLKEEGMLHAYKAIANGTLELDLTK